MHSEWNSMVSIVLHPTTRVVKSSLSAQGSGGRLSKSREDLRRPLYCMNHCIDLVLLLFSPSVLSLAINSFNLFLGFISNCSDLFRLADLNSPSSRLSPVTLNLPRYGHCLGSGLVAESENC